MPDNKASHGGKRKGAGRKPYLRPEEKREKKSYYATPAEHTHLSACLRAMREAQGAEEAGKDQEPE